MIFFHIFSFFRNFFNPPKEIKFLPLFSEEKKFSFFHKPLSGTIQFYALSSLFFSVPCDKMYYYTPL